MKKYLVFVLTFAFIALLATIFLPRKYPTPPPGNPPNTQYWQLPTGSKIAYTLLSAKGIKKPHPIVYLHGGPGGHISKSNLENLAPLTEEGYDVYLYDQIGGGQSARLDDIKQYTVERHLLDLTAILEQIAAKKVILIGQSWGAVLATIFVAEHQDRVERLILTGPGPIYPVQQAYMQRKSPDSLHLRAPLMSNAQGNQKMNNLRTKTVAWWAVAFGSKLASDQEMDDFQTILGGEVNKSTVCDTANAPKPNSGGGYYAQVMTMKSLNEWPDFRQKLKKCPIPLYILRGQCDNQKWGAVEEYLEIFPRHTLEIAPNAGHFIGLEARDFYIETLRRFVR
jgi:proline iminopeptidase